MIKKTPFAIIAYVKDLSIQPNNGVMSLGGRSKASEQKAKQQAMDKMMKWLGIELAGQK
jgi:hypothetical protein